MNVSELLEGTAAYLITEKENFDKLERETRAKLRNASTDELLDMLDHYDFRFAQVVRNKVGRGGWHLYPGGKILGMKQLPELDSLKLILQRLQTMGTGGSLLESMRVMVMIAILEHLTRQLQGLIG